MTAKLDEMISNLDRMSKEDLRTLQDQIAEKLKNDESAAEESLEDDEKMKNLLKVGYRPSSKFLENILAQLLTPEELAELDDSELDDFPTLPKTITEYINEDREERL